MNKKMFVDIRMSDLYYIMFKTLHDFNNELNKFKAENGQFPEEINIPEFHIKGIPIKTKKIKNNHII